MSLFSALITSLLLFVYTVTSLQKRDVTAILADNSTVIGYEAEGLSTFSGIPFAQPPVGDLRLRPAQPITTPLGTIDATQEAKACPQFALSLDASSLPEKVAAELINTPFGQNLVNMDEDCLTLTIIAPPDAKPGDNLPVLFWIYGGAFSAGTTSTYNGSTYVADSIAQDKPIIWVAVNYRLNGFGLMPGKEVLAEGSTNLALRDQRLGMLS